MKLIIKMLNLIVIRIINCIRLLSLHLEKVDSNHQPLFAIKRMLRMSLLVVTFKIILIHRQDILSRSIIYTLLLMSMVNDEVIKRRIKILFANEYRVICNNLIFKYTYIFLLNILLIRLNVHVI